MPQEPHPYRLLVEGKADPDPGLDARWQSVRDRLLRAGVGLTAKDIPAEAPGKGWVSQSLQLGYDIERIGIWLMPDNRMTGILEDFVVHLIAPDDRLLPKADQILDELEDEAIQPYSSVERPKARIHTWLAWQSPPGRPRPMGQAITASVLRDDTPLALEFIEWFNNLYGAMEAELSTVPLRPN